MDGELDLTGKSFEDLLEMLEEAVDELDGDTLTLEQSIEAYERSVAISLACQKLLDEAELRIEVIDAKALPQVNDADVEYDIS